jgi:hypothetical protein
VVVLVGFVEVVGLIHLQWSVVCVGPCFLTHVFSTTPRDCHGVTPSRLVLSHKLLHWQTAEMGELTYNGLQGLVEPKHVLCRLWRRGGSEFI